MGSGIHSSKVEFTGIVTPCEWDDDGQAQQVKVCLPGETDFLISKEDKGLKLLKLLRETVYVEGILTLNSIGQEIVKVKRFKVKPQGE